MSEYRIVFVTVPSMQEAKKIAKEVLSKRVAACVNIVPKLTSLYIWNDEICEDEELLLLIKTKKEHLKALEGLVKKLHSYEVPEFVAMEIVEGSKEYLAWIEGVL